MFTGAHIDRKIYVIVDSHYFWFIETLEVFFSVSRWRPHAIFIEQFFDSRNMISLSTQRLQVREFNSNLFSVPIPRQKSRLSHVNGFLRHYGGQLKTKVEPEAGEKIDCKR